eukprot:1160422-Pelagomonas_calceolata.AAC.14
MNLRRTSGLCWGNNHVTKGTVYIWLLKEMQSKGTACAYLGSEVQQRLAAKYGKFLGWCALRVL